jgi:hypothetical protein
MFSRLRLLMRSLTRSVGASIAMWFAISANAQTPRDFTGHWRLQTNAGEQHQLEIVLNGDALRVETIVTNSKGTRRLVLTYQIGGRETVYKGLDGDKFRSRVHWDGSILVFEATEHEGGRKIPETTVWTLSEDRNTLQLKRHSTKKDSSATYIRQP